MRKCEPVWVTISQKPNDINIKNNSLKNLTKIIQTMKIGRYYGVDYSSIFQPPENINCKNMSLNRAEWLYGVYIKSGTQIVYLQYQKFY